MWRSATPSSATLGGYYTACTAANLDGDVSLTGHPIDDFVAVNSDYGTLSVLLGDSSGYLQSASYLSAGSYPCRWLRETLTATR